MTRVVQISAYPTHTPMHGGQIRAHHIGRVLETAGHDVIRLPFFCDGHYPSQSEEPIIDLTPGINMRRYPHIGEVIDVTLSELVATDDNCFAIFATKMEEAHADIVLLEEPWLWPAVRRWLKDQVNPPPVIFSAYNVETQAKANILADKKYAQTRNILGEIEALERELVRSAAGVVVTTESDAETFRTWTDRPIAVARNGTAPRSLAHLTGVLPAPLKPKQNYLLFVGSAHPPNAAGFLSMVLPALPRLRSHERIVLAGGVCGLVASKLGEHGPNALVRDRTVFLGPVSALGLECLIANASGILLPITYGGGSNLKTAEALSSGLPIVGTSIAFRGFEEFMRLPQVTVADTPDAFARALQHTLQTQYGPRQKLVVTELYWDRTLQPVVELVNAVAGNPVRNCNAGVLA